MNIEGRPESNPYSTPEAEEAAPVDFATTFEETAVINSTIMRQATRLHGGSSYRIRRAMMLLFSLTMVTFGGIITWRTTQPTVSTVFLVGFGVYIFVRGIAFDWFIEKKWQKLLEQSGEANQTLHYIIGPEWLEVNTKDFTSRVRYTALYKWKDGVDMLLIYRNASYFQVVPCSQFSSEGRTAIRNRLSHFIG